MTVETPDRASDYNASYTMTDTAGRFVVNAWRGVQALGARSGIPLSGATGGRCTLTLIDDSGKHVRVSISGDTSSALRSELLAADNVTDQFDQVPATA